MSGMGDATGSQQPTAANIEREKEFAESGMEILGESASDIVGTLVEDPGTVVYLWALASRSKKLEDIVAAADDLMRLDRGLESIAALPPGKVSMQVQLDAHTRLHEALRRLTDDA